MRAKSSFGFVNLVALGCLHAQNIMYVHIPDLCQRGLNGATNTSIACSMSGGCWNGDLMGGLYWNISISSSAYAFGCSAPANLYADAMAVEPIGMSAYAYVLYLGIFLDSSSYEDCNGVSESTGPVGAPC